MFNGEVLDRVHLTAEPKGELSRKVVSIATKCVMVDRPVSEPAAGISALTALLQDFRRRSTRMYSVVGSVIDRIRDTATKPAAAGIVAQYPDGSYAALRLDLTGQVNSAADSELVAAVLACKAGTTHTDHITDCKSLLDLDARLKNGRHMQYHQRSLMAFREIGAVELRWHKSHPGVAG